MLQTIIASPNLAFQMIAKLVKTTVLGITGFAFAILAFGCLSAIDFRISTGFASFTELLFFALLGLMAAATSLASFLNIQTEKRNPNYHS